MLIQFLVGGVSYAVAQNLLEKFPDSYFGQYVKPGPDMNLPVVIERDGIIFQYIHDFLRFGTLPRDKNGKLLIDAHTKAALKIEADFFQLHELVQECDSAEMPDGAPAHFAIYRQICKNLKNCEYGSTKWTFPRGIARRRHPDTEMRFHQGPSSDDSYESSEEDEDDYDDRQFTELLAQACAPFCITGKIDPKTLSKEQHSVLGKSTVTKPKVKELLAKAKVSPFGKGKVTLVDKTVRNSHEIDISDNRTTCQPFWDERFVQFAPRCHIKMKPYKIVIYQEGGHFKPHRDTVRGEGHIGTLVLILNSEYTGGELEVSHGDRTEVVTGAYSWVAMYGDCLHKINPVTSGTRISLIYDIYAQVKEPFTMFYEPPLTEAPLFIRGAEPTAKQRIVAEMRKQLAHGADVNFYQRYEAVAICLQHLYPACQANPDFLKGGDQLLYDIFKDDFSVSIIPCIIYRRVYDWNNMECDENDDVCGIIPYAGPPAADDGVDSDEVEAIKAAATVTTKVLISGNLTSNLLLDYERVNYTGNESEAEDKAYMVATLWIQNMPEHE